MSYYGGYTPYAAYPTYPVYGAGYSGYGGYPAMGYGAGMSYAGGYGMGMGMGMGYSPYSTGGMMGAGAYRGYTDAMGYVHDYTILPPRYGSYQGPYAPSYYSGYSGYGAPAIMY